MEKETAKQNRPSQPKKRQFVNGLSHAEKTKKNLTAGTNSHGARRKTRYGAEGLRKKGKTKRQKATRISKDRREKIETQKVSKTTKGQATKGTRRRGPERLGRMATKERKPNQELGTSRRT